MRGNGKEKGCLTDIWKRPTILTTRRVPQNQRGDFNEYWWTE